MAAERRCTAAAQLHPRHTVQDLPRLSEGALHERYYLFLGVFIMLQIVNNFSQVVVGFKAEQSQAGLDSLARLLNAYLQQVLKQRLQSFLETVTEHRWMF